MHATAVSLVEQACRLGELGVTDLAGVAVDDLVAAVEERPARSGDVLVPSPAAVPAGALVPLLRRDGRPGFVVADMDDLDEFAPIPGVGLPSGPFYLLEGVDRGDDLRDRTPDDAVPEIVARGRTPLTAGEGVAWLLQEPGRLEPGRCFMTPGSRLRTSRGVDARVPALWISGGTGRDGPSHRGAPKLGWCWAGNRHTWLGFASAARRAALPVR